ncbi:hypothetical protein [Asaia bogorensis]|uniref:hypothetical protein n=1 Tax=Asaia bogorensis TaxID=91915 RepID=UPI000EFD4932|nr:hypothetical protein [Asaia bogorensis]
MNNSRCLIDRLGGVQSVAENLELNWKRVHNWTRPGRMIPARLWPQLMRLGAVKGVAVTLETLEGLQANPTERRAEPRKHSPPPSD